MAATGYTPIQLYYSSTASAIPLAANLANGELAINITDGKIYYKNNSGVVTLFGSTGDVSTISFGTTGLTPSTATGGAITVAGTLITSNGGTGLSSYTAGDLPYYASGTALSKLGIGSNGYILQSNGTAPTWVAASSVVGGAAGSNTQIQYNNSGALGASSSFVFDGTNVGIGTSSPTQKLDVAGSGATRLVVRDTSSTGIARLIASGADAYVGNASATGNFIIQTNSSNIATFDTSGNLGLGVTPSAWGVGSKAIELPVNGVFSFQGTNGLLTANTYYDGTNWKYKTSAAASFYYQSSGAHSWTTAASGTAGNNVTWTTAMTLDASGNLGIGTSSSLSKLHVSGSDIGNGLFISKGATAISFVGAESSYLGTGTSNNAVIASYGSNNLLFGTNAAVRATLDSSGNLGLGVTPSAWGSSGTLQAIQIKNTSLAGSGTNAYWGSNWFGGGFDKYIQTGAASLAVQTSGQHIWYTAPSGTAGNAITFTQAMTLDASGNLGIGGTSSGKILSIQASDTTNSVNGQAGLQIINTNAGAAGRLTSVTFGGRGSANYPFAAIAGSLESDSAQEQAGSLLFYTKSTTTAANPTERMRIDSSGNVGIGTSSPTGRFSVAGAQDANLISLFDNSAIRWTWYLSSNGLRLYNYATSADAMIIDSSSNALFAKAVRATITTDNDLSFDMNAASNFKCTPSAGGALTFTNITSGQTGNIILVNGSNYAITAAATTKVSSTCLATISATGTYWLSYYSDGTNVYVANTGALA